MYSNYRISKRGTNNANSGKQWNGSTRISKLHINNDYFQPFRMSPEPRQMSKNFLRNASFEPSEMHSSSFVEGRAQNRSFLQLESISAKSSKILANQGKIKSLGLRHDLERKYKVPNFVAHAISEIFVPNNKEPVGLAVLISGKLMLTSHQALPNERYAMRSVFRFIQDKTYYKPRADKFYYSSLQYNLAVIAVSRMRKDSEKKSSIRLEQIPSLSIGDILFCAESLCFRVQVSLLEPDSYGITSHFTPLSGCPIFNSTWSLVGLAHTTSMTYKYTDCASLSSIFQVLGYIRSRYNFEIAPAQFDKTQDLPQIKQLKWFEFSGEYVEVFHVEKAQWDYKTVSFQIPWHCCPVSVGDEITLLLGGLRKELAVDEVYRYNSETNETHVLAHMGMARAFCAAVFYDNVVFAIGGKFASTFCEKYLIEEDRWEYIPSMLHERYDLSAVVLNHSVYVIGGEPVTFFGDMIEKYDILREMWEEVPTRLPFPVACPAICVVDKYACGVLGGRGSRAAFVVEVSRFQSNDVSIKEGGELNEEIESIYPAVYSKTQKKVFVLNTAEGFARPILYKVHSSYLPL
jgi:hypothetical protein